MWLKAWPYVKDVMLTALGIAVIISQIFMANPSVTLTAAGLALCGVVASIHVWSALGLSITKRKPPGDEADDQSAAKPGP